MSGYIHSLYITEGGVAFLTQKERGFLRAVANLGYCNPFLPERIQYEREALGADFREAEPVWSLRVADPNRPHVNIIKTTAKVETLSRSCGNDSPAGRAPRRMIWSSMRPASSSSSIIGTTSVSTRRSSARPTRR